MLFENWAKSGRHSFLNYVAGLFFIFLGYGVIGVIPLQLVINSAKSALPEAEQEGFSDRFFAEMDFSILGVSNNVGLILMICLFGAAILGLILGLGLLRKRLMDLISPSGQIDLSRILLGFGFWMVLTFLNEGILFLMNPEDYRWNDFDPTQFGILLLVSFLLLPIQTSAEEFIFRGYLMQMVGFFSRNKLAAWIISSSVFAAMHLSNPEILEYGIVPMTLYYLSAGFFLGVLVILDGRMELALGVHAATNIYASAFVGYDGGAIQTDCLVMSQLSNVWVVLVLYLVLSACFLWFFAKKYRWPSLRNALQWSAREPIS